MVTTGCVDSEPKYGEISSASTVSDYITSTCSLVGVKALSTQIADEVGCMAPGSLVKFEAGGGITINGDDVLPYLAADAKTDLLAVGDVQINSAFRTVDQQYLLYQWYQLGLCGIPIAAYPGNSNHESGRAVDLENYDARITAMADHGWSHDVAGDPVHFDHLSSPDIRGKDTLAFQRLWNRNHPSDLIGEDGAYGPQTESRLRQAPANGFATGATCGATTAYAANVVGIDGPQQLAAGASAHYAITVANTGTADWPATTLLVVAGGGTSELYDAATWSSPTQVGAIQMAIPAGMQGALELDVVAPSVMTDTSVATSFALSDAGHEFGTIPLAVMVTVDGGGPTGGGKASTSGCSAGSDVGWLAGVPFLLFVLRRRRGARAGCVAALLAGVSGCGHSGSRAAPDSPATAADGQGDAVAVTCPSAPPEDPLAAARAACTFEAGALVEDTIGDVSALRASITHVLIITQENHTLDALLGTTGNGIAGWPGTYSNVASDGTRLRPQHLTTACPVDPYHDRTACLTGWDNGQMDGFARANPTTRAQTALGYYTASDHPFYTWLAMTFATSDHYFAAVLDATSPNRHYLYGGQINPTTTLFDELDAAHITWKDYTPGSALEGAFGWTIGNPSNVHSFGELAQDLQAGTLPPVTFVDMPDDEHPSHDLHGGENDVRGVITGAMASPLWPHMAIIMNYDEGGGFFDHVPPPSACVAVPADAAYDHYGVRVPVFVVSPFARARFVSHDLHSHTSVLRFIEALFDLPALTKRDASADALLDMFDFACPAFATPPDPTSIPAAHPRGC